MIRYFFCVICFVWVSLHYLLYFIETCRFSVDFYSFCAEIYEILISLLKYSNRKSLYYGTIRKVYI
mgnify:CR=1 FL=1